MVIVESLGAASAIVFVQIIVVGLVGSYMGKSGSEGDTADGVDPVGLLT